MKDHFRLHQVEGYICSLFLAEYDDKILILDSGCASDVPRLVNFISNELHRPMSDVKLAVATHGHPDHSGGACELHRRYAIPIAAPRGLFERYKGFSGLFCKVVDCLLIWTVARKMKKRFENVWFDNHFTPNYIYTDEGRLPLFHDWAANRHHAIESPAVSYRKTASRPMTMVHRLWVQRTAS
jgi:glyoxylase-like metal-dependent hydrolase (beta-lactamase superfamily II)